MVRVPPVIADEELAAIVARAAQLGIPAWRVTAALGLSTSAEQPAAKPPQDDAAEG